MSYEYFDERWKFIKQHFILCFALTASGFAGGYALNSQINAAEVRAAQERAETLQTRLDFSASGDAMKMKTDMEERLESAKKELLSCGKASLEACRMIVPELDEYSSDQMDALITELDKLGCAVQQSAECKAPVLTLWLHDYLYLRDRTNAVLGKYDEIVFKSKNHPHTN